MTKLRPLMLAACLALSFPIVAADDDIPDPTRPLNDDQIRSQELFLRPYVWTQSTLGATEQLGEPLTCGGAPYGSTVWFFYEAATSGTLIVDTSGSSYDTVARIAGTCNDDDGFLGTASYLSIQVVAGQTYQIQIGGYGSGGGAEGSLTVALNLNVG